MDAEAKKIMENVIEYIQKVEPELEKFSELKEEIVKQARETAAVLAHCGIIDDNKKDEVVDTFIKNPTASFNLIRKMAKYMGRADSLGYPSEKLSENNDLDPFERWVLFGHPNASGLV